MLLEEVKRCNTSLSGLNYIKLPITNLDPIAEYEKCNELLRILKENYQKGTFIHTKSGGISKTVKNVFANKKFEVRKLAANGVIEVLIYDCDRGWARVNIRNCARMVFGGVEKMKVFGTQALRQLLKHTDLSKDFSLDEELNRKKQEEARHFYHVDKYPNIGFEGIPVDAEYTIGRELRNCVCSLDIHSAFPAALTRVRPQTRAYIEDLYQNRKVKPENKQLLNLAIGAMTMDATTHLGCGAKKALSPLRYEVLKDHSIYLHKLMMLLRRQGATIINLRTDSIKFIWTKDTPPILPGKGDGLGDWGYEFYKADRYRQFSTGCYQYEVDGKHTVVYSGLTKYEVEVKPREQWTWDELEQIRNSPYNDVIMRRYDYSTDTIIRGCINEQETSKKV